MASFKSSEAAVLFAYCFKVAADMTKPLTTPKRPNVFFMHRGHST